MADAHAYTDEEAVEQARKNKDAFALLVERYAGRLGRYLERLGVFSADDRDDLLQNIFIKVYRNLNEFDTGLSFSSWIYRIAHNEAVSFFRSRRPERGNIRLEEKPELLELLHDESDTAGQAEARINAEHVAHALAELDPKYRDALVLRVFEERDYAAISDILQIPMGSVATLIHRAKKQLREKLKHLS